MANRFNKIGIDLQYSPESFKDMAVAPIAMRNRHDKYLENADNYLNILNNIDVPEEGREYYNQKKEEITNRISGLTDKINQTGAGDSGVLGDFRNLKRDYEKETSLSGGLGYLADFKRKQDEITSQAQKFGVANKWSASTIQMNLDKYNKEYFDKNDLNKVGDKDFIRNKYEPNFAPEFKSVIDIASEVKPLLGNLAKNVGLENIRFISNGDGTISLRTKTTTMDSDNAVALKDAEDLLNEIFKDPNSKAMLSEKYNLGINPNDSTKDAEVRESLMKKMGMALDMMHVKSEASDINTTIQPIGDGTRANGKGIRTGKEEDQTAATLVGVPGGKEINDFDDNTFSSLMTGTYIDEFEKDEKNNGNNIDSNRNLKKGAAIRAEYVINKSLKQPGVIEKIDKSISSENFEVSKDLNNVYSEKVKIKSLDELKSYIKKSSENYNSDLNIIKKIKNNEKLTPEETKRWENQAEFGASLDYTPAMLNEAKALLKKSYSESIGTDTLNYSQVYTFGAGEDANKFRKVVNESLDGQGMALVQVLNNNGGDFSDVNGNYYDYNNTPENKGYSSASAQIKKLQKDLESGDAKFEFSGLTDHGSTGVSQIGIKYTVGTGDKRKSGLINLNYDPKTTSKDNELLDNFLYTMKDNLDFKGKAVVQSFIDNRIYADVPVDNLVNVEKGLSDYQSNKIVEYNKIGVPTLLKGNKEYAEIDYIKTDPKDKDRYKYNLVLDDEGYHTLYRKEKGKPVTVTSVESWMKKDSFKRNIEERKTWDGTPGKNILTDYNNIGNDNYITFIEEMSDLAKLSEKGDGVIRVAKPGYEEIRTTYIESMLNTTDLQTQLDLSKHFWNEIKKFGISHKNKKRAI